MLSYYVASSIGYYRTITRKTVFQLFIVDIVRLVLRDRLVEACGLSIDCYQLDV